MSDTTKPVYTYHWVRPFMQEIKEKKINTVQVGTKTIVKTKGVIRKEEYEIEEPVYEDVEELVPTGKYSDTNIDLDNFAIRVTKACNELYADGYEVVHMSGILGGRYTHNTWEGVNKHGRFGQLGQTWGAAWGYGYGYSVTDGILIIAKLRDL